ncbi:hypothetical protein [Bradyrhizobium sp. B120]|uniref:hypothetical protein n=1 Tax=Bradyrhizobium sp. B120 TaxID=3410088 RepID=UPI003B97EA0F
MIEAFQVLVRGGSQPRPASIRAAAERFPADAGKISRRWSAPKATLLDAFVLPFNGRDGPARNHAPRVVCDL